MKQKHTLYRRKSTNKKFAKVCPSYNNYSFGIILPSTTTTTTTTINQNNNQTTTTTTTTTTRSVSLKQVDLLRVSNCGATLAVGLMADGEGTSAKRTIHGLRAPKTASSGRRPGVLTEPEPQGQERPRTFPRCSQVAPEPRPLVHLGVGEVHDGPLVSFFLQRALFERRKEEEERKAEFARKVEGARELRVKEEVEEVEEEADASDLLSLSSWPRSTSTLAVASSFCWFCWCCSFLRCDARHHGRYGPEGHVLSTAPCWFLPEGYSTSLFWENTSGNAVFSAFWLDSGYIFMPVYGFLRVLSPHSAQCLVLRGPRYPLVTEFASSISLSWCRGRFPWSRVCCGPSRFPSCSSTR